MEITWSSLLFLEALPWGGCFTSYGFALGPTVDTRGNVGLQVSVRASIGVPFGDQDAIGEVLRVDAAPPGLAVPQVSPTVGIVYVHEPEDDGLAIQAELLGRFQLAWEDSFRSWIGVGASLGLLPTLDVPDNDTGDYTHLGVELEGYFLADDNAKVPEGQSPPRMGLFGVSLVYEQIYIDQDPFGDIWD